MFELFLNELESWKQTGIVHAKKEGVSFSVNGAISLLIGYAGMSIFSLILGLTYFLKKNIKDE